MQKTAENKIKRTEKGTFLIDGIRTIKAIPSQEEENAWNIVDTSTIVELDEKELIKVKATGSDEEKVLRVKRLFLQGSTPTEISSKTGFSRTTVYRYKKLLSAMNAKKPVKNAHSTKTLKSVLPIFLIFNSFAACGTIVVLVLLLITVVHSILKRKHEEYLNDYLLHRESKIKLHTLITDACDYSFKQGAIICKSDKEAAYYRKILVHYHNKSREIIVVPRDFGENNLQYFDRRKRTKIQYDSNNYIRVEAGQKNFNEYWEKIKEKKYLSYLHYYSNITSFLYNRNKPLSEERLLSKLFLVSLTEFLSKNPRPVFKDKARNKPLLEALASTSLSIEETQIIEENELRIKIPKTVEL